MASFDNRENRFHEAATICTLGTKGELAPNHSRAQSAFTHVVGRFDPFNVQKRPQLLAMIIQWLAHPVQLRVAAEHTAQSRRAGN